MGYPLQSMLVIRTMREDRAASDLTKARLAREESVRVLEEKRETFERWTRTKESRRDRVYAAVMGRAVKREALEQAREAVTRIDEEGVLLEEDEHRAEAVVEQRTKETAAAQTRYIVAGKNREKICMHREAWEEEDRKQAEYLADAELEEFTGKKGLDEDDD